MTDEALVAQAAAVLRANDLGDYTRPSPRLYPHQWNWDTGFVAIGWAHLDWGRATREIDALLGAQWTDGFLPHIRYNPDAPDYQPGPDWWSDVPVRQPGVLTSGISQPPVVASAAYTVGMQQPDATARHAWWARVFDGLQDALRYFARHRTLGESPLIAIIHPWESGLDNSPRWDEAVRLGLRPSRPYRRTDTTVVAARARPHEADYDLYLHLVEQIAASRYDMARYLPRAPFAVYDALFNAVWYRGAGDLNRMAAALGRPPAVAPEALARFRAAYHRTLWHGPSALFRDFDARAGRPIAADTAAGLIAIFGGLVDAGQARTMLSAYGRRSPGCRRIPSVPPDEPAFDPERYWRGPVWVNVNWMVARGLEDLGAVDEARALAAETLDLVRTAGIHEYYHPFTGEALGGGTFSWTAALVIDLVRRPVGGPARGTPRT